MVGCARRYVGMHELMEDLRAAGWVVCGVRFGGGAVVARVCGALVAEVRERRLRRRIGRVRRWGKG